MTDQELIRRMAEMMGWVYIPEKETLVGEYQVRQFEAAKWVNEYGQFMFWAFDWQPLTNANHWIMVVERMREKGWRIIIKSYNLWEVEFWDKGQYFAEHNMIGHAVCLAALKAGIESGPQGGLKGDLA